MQLGVLMFPSPRGSARAAQLVEQSRIRQPRLRGHAVPHARGLESADAGRLGHRADPDWDGGHQPRQSRSGRDRLGGARPADRERGTRRRRDRSRRLIDGEDRKASLPRPPTSNATWRTPASLHGRPSQVDRDGNPSRIEWLDECEVPHVPIEVAATGPKVIEHRRTPRGSDLLRRRSGRRSTRGARSTALAEVRRSSRSGSPKHCEARRVRELRHPPRPRRRPGGDSRRTSLRSRPSPPSRAWTSTRLPEGVRDSARHLRENYDMADHGLAGSAHAQAIDDAFVHRFGIAGPIEEAVERFGALRDLGLEFVRVVPGSRDMDATVRTESVLAIAKHVLPVVNTA